MTSYDIENLIGYVDLEQFINSLAQTKFDELIKIYKSLSQTVKVCLECDNIPQVVYTLSEFQYVYALEIVERYLYGSEYDAMH